MHISKGFLAHFEPPKLWTAKRLEAKSRRRRPIRVVAIIKWWETSSLCRRHFLSHLKQMISLSWGGFAQFFAVGYTKKGRGYISYKKYLGVLILKSCLLHALYKVFISCFLKTDVVMPLIRLWLLKTFKKTHTLRVVVKTV